MKMSFFCLFSFELNKLFGCFELINLINSPDIRSFALALQDFCRPCPQVVWGEFLPATGCAKSPELLVLVLKVNITYDQSPLFLLPLKTLPTGLVYTQINSNSELGLFKNLKNI
jgi:hypothetical protein